MNRKEKFLSAVRTLAPGDAHILRLAQRVSEDNLPEYPGAAALEFVAYVDRIITPCGCLASRRPLGPRKIRPARTRNCDIITVQC